MGGATADVAGRCGVLDQRCIVLLSMSVTGGRGMVHPTRVLAQGERAQHARDRLAATAACQNTAAQEEQGDERDPGHPEYHERRPVSMQDEYRQEQHD